MPSFEIRWGDPNFDLETWPMTAVFDGPVSPEAKAAFRKTLEAFVRDTGPPIRFLVYGPWDPEEPIPTARWED